MPIQNYVPKSKAVTRTNYLFLIYFHKNITKAVATSSLAVDKGTFCRGSVLLPVLFKDDITVGPRGFAVS